MLEKEGLHISPLPNILSKDDWTVWFRVTVTGKGSTLNSNQFIFHSVSTSLQLLRKIPLLSSLTPSSYEWVSPDIADTSTLFDWISSQVNYLLIMTFKFYLIVQYIYLLYVILSMEKNGLCINSKMIKSRFMKFGMCILCTA